MFCTLEPWLTAYRQYQRDEKGELVKEGHHLMGATALLALYGPAIAVTEFQAGTREIKVEKRGSGEEDWSDISETGY